jgi:hypothetical protein
MRKIFLWALSSLSISAISQDAKLNWGPELPKPKKTDISTLIGCDRNSFYCLRVSNALFKRGEASLEKYSRAKLAPEYAKAFTIPDIGGKELSFEKIFLIKGTLVVFASRYDRDADRNTAYIHRINASDGSAIGVPKEIDYIVSDNKRNPGSFEFTLSNDSTKILITHHEPYEKYASEKFSYKLVDESGHAFWTAAIELPYKDKYFTVGNYVVDNDGSVYMLATVTKERSERERKKPAYSYDLITYNAATKALTETPVSLGDKYISDISFALTSKGTVAMGGFYSNKNEDGLAGTFFISLDKKTKKTVSQGTKDLSTEFLGKFMSSRRAEKHRELYHYVIDHLVTRKDGGLYMIAEQFYINVVTVRNQNGSSSTTYHYYYNDIIVVNINPDSSIEWIKRIPKTQHSTNDYGYYSGYSFFVSNDKMYFIYNDHPKNMAEEEKKPRNGISRKMITIMAEMDSRGNLTRKALTESKKERIFTRPKVSLSLGGNQFLFYAIRSKKYKFGSINS